ncbi:MAG: hypothetical protein AAF542_17840 [Pseudomonadota bacterium]
MATKHGRKGLVKVGSATVAQVKNWEFTETADEIDTTVMNPAGDKSSDPGGVETSGSMLCLFDTADATGQGALTVGAVVTLELYTGPDSTGEVYYSTTTAKVMSRSSAADVGAMVERNINFKADGAMTENTVS